MIVINNTVFFLLNSFDRFSEYVYILVLATAALIDFLGWVFMDNTTFPVLLSFFFLLNLQLAASTWI